jgi:hypothetical protein
MTNSRIAAAATPGTPYALKVSDMFAAMPYENSLVVMSMNGPQLKAVLERAYRNYYYYKYVPGYGGYSYYTTCMLDTNAGNEIIYNDLNPALPNGNNVVELLINSVPVDFEDAETYYNVSSVNYLAAGACNFSDAGKTLWPLDQIVADTQYYVRDAVIEYVQAQTAPIGPAIEGRLSFIKDVTGPVITIDAPLGNTYVNTQTISFTATDDTAGVRSISGAMNGAPVIGQVVNLYQYPAGVRYTLHVTAMDKAYNPAEASITFFLDTNMQSMKTVVIKLYNDGAIKKAAVRDSLLKQLDIAQMYLNQGNIKAAKNSLNAFMNLVKAQSGKAIVKGAADLLIADAAYLITNPK